MCQSDSGFPISLKYFLSKGVDALNTALETAAKRLDSNLPFYRRLPKGLEELTKSLSRKPGLHGEAGIIGELIRDHGKVFGQQSAPYQKCLQILHNMVRLSRDS